MKGIKSFRGIALGAMLFFVSGCIFAVEDNGADTVTIALESEVTETARLLVTTDFRFNLLADGVGIQMAEADTFTVTLPFEQNFDIRISKRFYFLLLDEAADDDDQLIFKVALDGDEKLERRNVPGGDPLQFIYVFGEAVPPGDLIVL